MIDLLNCCKHMISYHASLLPTSNFDYLQEYSQMESLGVICTPKNHTPSQKYCAYSGCQTLNQIEDKNKFVIGFR